MRTVLDPAAIAYEQGYQAFISGVTRDSNPYQEEPKRQGWFDGWDFANGVKR